MTYTNDDQVVYMTVNKSTCEIDKHLVEQNNRVHIKDRDVVES